MTHDRSLERLLADRMADPFSDRLPDRVLDETFVITRGSRPMPRWLALLKEPPMRLSNRVAVGSPTARLAFVAAMTALLVIALAGAVLAAGSPAPSPAVNPTPPPAPIVQNGLIAFESAEGIQVANPDGSGQRVLIPGSANVKPVWSFDGSHLAYESLGPGSNWQLIVVNPDGSQPVTVASGTLGGGMTSGPSASWSPDGTTLAYSARTPQTGSCPGNGSADGDFCTSRIFVAAADGSGSHQIGDPTLDVRSPSWSPDGKSIAFGGGNASQLVHLYVMDAAGTNVRQLSDVRGFQLAFLRDPWSPDGTLIAGQASATDNIDQFDIWTIPVDGSAPTDVGSHSAMDSILPTWAPDRNALAWLWNGQAVLMDVGASPVVLPPTDLSETVWSPDGTLLAVEGGSTVKVIGLDGSVRASIPDATRMLSWQRQTVIP
jgi:hypothetical protein